MNNTGQVNGLSFTVMLGYIVSGTVAYHGTLTGRTYLNLIGNCSSGAIGTSLSPDELASGGAFTLHGVSPGTYTLQAWMDPSVLDNGAQNDSDPAGSASSVTVSTTNVTGLTVTMADPTLTAPTAGPKLKAITPTNTGVVISYGDNSVIDSSTGKEAFSSYLVQWSTSSGFSGTPSSSAFRAVGSGYNVWILSNGNAGMSGSLASGTLYYFRVRGANSAGNSNWVYWGGSGSPCSSTCAVGVTIGEPAGGSYATVTGAISISTEMAPLITGPLYAGYYDPNTGTAYAYVVQNPVIGNNGYSIPVLKSATIGYVPFGILDQNKDGLIDTGDVTNFTTNPPPVVINSSTTGLIELSYLYELGRVQTHYVQNTWYRNGTPNTAGSYSLKFVDIPDIKRPVSVQLVSGPHVVTPMDIGNFCSGGNGGVQFCNEVYLGGATPQLGDNYSFKIVLSDGTLWDGGASIIGFSGSGSITGPSNVPTNLVPTGNVPGQTQPTFSWTYPAPASPWAQPVKYQFWLCCSGNYPIWWIPGYNSGLDGFTSNQIPGSIAWGSDPTDSTNKPSLPSLTIGTSYTWQIQGQDEFGNVAASQTSFIP